MIHLLCVGASEVKMFRDGKRWLRQEYGIDVDTEFRSGAMIDECLSLLRRGMRPTVDIVLVWALTTLAWRRMTIHTKGRRDITVFCPNHNTSISNVPSIMNLLSKEMYNQNPNCIMYLVLPAIKDLYTFNQTRIVRGWGSGYKDFLQDHPMLNAEKMRQHSKKVYNLFKTLLNDEYQWVDKHIIQAGYAISHFYEHRGKNKRINEKSPVVYFLEGKSDTLNCSLLPDGLHGNTSFLEAFMRSIKNIFYQISGHDRHGEPVAKKGKTIHSRMLIHARRLPDSSDDDDDNNNELDFPRDNQESNSGTCGSPDNGDSYLRRFVEFREPTTSYAHEEYHPTPIISNVPRSSHIQSGKETTWGDSHEFYSYTLPDYDYGKCPGKHDDAGAVASTSTGITHNIVNYDSEMNITFFQAGVRKLIEQRSTHTGNNLEYQSWLFHDLEQAVKREKRIHYLRKQM